MKKVGLLGGTFDPPHYGHLLIAEEVHRTLDLDEVWFIPSQEPPHKEKARTPARYRVKMVEAAIESNSHFRLHSIEVERSGKSYTIDTVKALKENNPETAFFFIIGADMVEYLPNWYKIEELISLVEFIGVKRPDHELHSPYSVKEVEVPAVDISSTMIRERLQTGTTARYLVTDPVLQVIKENHLYESF